MKVLLISTYELGRQPFGLASPAAWLAAAGATVYCLDKGDQWIYQGRLGEENETMAMVVYNGKLYAGSLPLAKVYRYDGGTTWTAKLEGELSTLGLDPTAPAVTLGWAVVLRKPGDRVAAGDALARLYYGSEDRLSPARRLVTEAFVDGDEAPPAAPLVLEVVR